MMKKALLLGLMATLASCSDGDLVYESLNFKDATIMKCDQNELFFKTNGHELLLVDLTGPNNEPLLTPDMPLGQMDSIQTNAINKIIYRSYDNPIDATTICGKIPPAFPKVTEEYVSANGGYIKYMRTMEVKGSETLPNRYEILYNYVFYFKNITLNNGQSVIKYETYNFGTYQPKKENSTETDSSIIEFNFSTLNSCDEKLVYGSGINKVIQIQLKENLPTQNGIYQFDLTSDQFVQYKSKNSALGNANLCSLSETTGYTEIWRSQNGQLQIEVSDFLQNNQTYKMYQFTILHGTFGKANKTFTVNQLHLGKLQK